MEKNVPELHGQSCMFLTLQYFGIHVATIYLFDAAWNCRQSCDPCMAVHLHSETKSSIAHCLGPVYFVMEKTIGQEMQEKCSRSVVEM